MKELLEKLIQPGGILLARQKEVWDEIYQKSIDDYGALVDANILITGALASAIIRVNGKPSENTEVGNASNGLIANFICGMDLCERAIKSGHYLQALALLRQELETIAALHEVYAGTRRDGKTPHVKNVRWELGKLYGDLSSAAHVSIERVVRELTTSKEHKLVDTIIWRYFNEYNQGLSARLYAYHIALMILIAEYLDKNHRDAFGKGLNAEEIKAMETALEILIQQGHFEPID